MKVIDFTSKKDDRDNGLHDTILESLDELKERLEADGEKADAMVCFLKTSQSQYYNSVVVHYGDLVEMIGLVDVMKLALIDAIHE